MKHALKPLTAALALVLALFAAPAALAQEQGQYSATDTVTVDFELKVNGGVPGWQYFHIEHPGEGASELALCTTHTERPGPLCETGGVYTTSMEVPAGDPVSFEFVRDGDPGPSETFASDSRTFTQDTTVHASYDFPEAGPPEPAEPSDNSGDQYADDGAQDAEDNDELPPVLPDTGGLPLLLVGVGLISAGAGLALLGRRLL